MGRGMGRRMGRGRGQGFGRGQGNMNWPGVRSGEIQPWYSHGLVVEVEPVLANALASRATTNLLLSLVAALILASAALVFWRLSRKAQGLALQAERDRRLTALGQMSAVLGHELRNPLASLKGHAQLLQEKLPPEHPALPKATIVVHEAVRLEKLTSQVLDFARTGELDIQPTSPGQLLRSASETFADQQVDIMTAVDLPDWPMDAARMQQVLVNLLDNAFRSSPAGSAVGLQAHLDSDDLVIEVRDRGPGLTPGDEERLFEPFYTNRTHGTGLGLALARRIVSGHGGSIQAANHPDGGALFTIRLPRIT
jgi:two-component system sensor histidine kinase HydH